MSSHSLQAINSSAFGQLPYDLNIQMEQEMWWTSCLSDFSCNIRSIVPYNPYPRSTPSGNGKYSDGFLIQFVEEERKDSLLFF